VDEPVFHPVIDRSLAAARKGDRKINRQKGRLLLTRLGVACGVEERRDRAGAIDSSRERRARVLCNRTG
jgi:hypothetical protein